MSAAKAVLGVPVHDEVTHLAPALRSLLVQAYEPFALVVIDDSGSDEPSRVVQETAGRDARLYYERNPRRLGLVASWQKAFSIARELHPDAEYFAWAGDHDLWEPGWLQALVEALDRRRSVVLAYPLNDAIDADGRRIREPWHFQTTGDPRRARRFVRVVRRMVAGDMVYGLFRAEALARAGVLRPVLLPDRLLLAELTLHGEFAQVPELLWHRRILDGSDFTRRRQRAAIFPGGVPLHAYLPWTLVHAAVLARSLACSAAASPGVSRLAALAAAASYPVLTIGFQAARRAQHLARSLR